MCIFLFPPSLHCFTGVLIGSLPLEEHCKKQLNRREEPLRSSAISQVSVLLHILDCRREIEMMEMSKFQGKKTWFAKRFARILEVVSASAQIGRWEHRSRISGDIADTEVMWLLFTLSASLRFTCSGATWLTAIPIDTCWSMRRLKCSSVSTVKKKNPEKYHYP